MKNLFKKKKNIRLDKVSWYVRMFPEITQPEGKQVMLVIFWFPLMLILTWLPFSGVRLVITGLLITLLLILLLDLLGSKSS
jgi:hypothetical protein